MFRFSILISSFSLLLVACSSQSTPTDVPISSPEPAVVEELDSTTLSQETDGSADLNLSENL